MMTAAVFVPVLSTYDAIDISAIGCCLLRSQKVCVGSYLI